MKKINLSGSLLPFAFVIVLLAACSHAPSDQPDQEEQSLPSGIELIETHHRQDGEVSIPYRKYKLENGLTVILHEDHSDPLVHVDVTYHVGSAREEPGKSGFAHFFEHMMFQGSKHVADDLHFKLVTEAGGNMNGSTSADRTNYYQTVPANQLEKMLWLEADRMGFLLDAVTQEKFEVQRETVKNERGQRIDNQPYGLLAEKTAEALYPVGHPYSWQTIGYVEDLDRVNVNDLKAFFKRWYGPNNAILTIGGDINVKQTLQWVDKYFASIPAGPEVEPAEPQPVTLSQDRFVTLEDQVYLPLVQVTYPTVHARHEDEAPLDVLADILGKGKTSLFYKNLVKDNFAVQAAVSHPCRELACEFQLVALANPTKTTDLSDIYLRMQQTLEEFERRGVNQDDLNRTKASIESSMIFGLQSVSGKVSTLASNEYLSDNPDMVQYDLDRYAAVTQADVMRVFDKYIKDQAKVVLSIVPQGATELAVRPANFSPPDRLSGFSESSRGQSEAVQQPQIEDDFDRSVIPDAGPAPVVEVPSLWYTQLDNHIQVMGHTSTETPTVTITLSLEGGPLLDPKDKAGLAYMTATMMNESTAQSSNEALSNRLALLGSQVNFNAAGRFTQVTVLSLRKNLAATLNILAEKLFQPGFNEQDFRRIKQSMLQALQQRLREPTALAEQAVRKVLYGSQNRISLPDDGTVATISAITLDDIKAFYAQYYTPAKANVVVVGDIEKAQIPATLAFLATWQGEDYIIPAYAPFPENNVPRTFLIDKPDAAQSIVRIVKRSMPYDAFGEQFKAKLMNFPLGGMFNSRINLNLREEKGFTYGATSAFLGGKSLGRFQVTADLNKQNTLEGISELLRELRQYRQQGMTQEELLTLRAAYTQSEALEYETPFSKARFLRHLLTYDLPRDYRQKQIDIIRTINRDTLNQLAQELLATDSMQLVVVGDASLIEQELKTLNRPIVKMNMND